MGEVIAQYKKKGEELYVEGKKKTETWEHEGKTQYKTTIIINNFEFIGTTKSDSTSNDTSNQNGLPIDDDLPF